MKPKKRTYKTSGNSNKTLKEPMVAYQRKRKNISEATVIKPVYIASKNVRRAISILGLQEEIVFETVRNTTDFIQCIRVGIPKKAFDHLIDIIDLSISEMADIIHISDRTLRRYLPNQKLNPEQSERVIEMAKLYARGEEVFEDIEQFKLWMSTPVTALGNKQPKVFLDTSMGINMLMDELGRIEQGIFA